MSVLSLCIGNAGALAYESLLYNEYENFPSLSKRDLDVDIHYYTNKSSQPQPKALFLDHAFRVMGCDMDRFNAVLPSESQEEYDLVMQRRPATPKQDDWATKSRRLGYGGITSDAFLLLQGHASSAIVQNGFEHGVQNLYTIALRDAIEERLRRMAERCDLVAGFTMYNDMNTSFAGLGLSVLDLVNDEYGASKFRISFGIDEMGSAEFNEVGMYNRFTALARYAHATTLFVPVSINNPNAKTHIRESRIELVGQAIYTALLPTRLPRSMPQRFDVTSLLSHLHLGIPAIHTLFTGSNAYLFPRSITERPPLVQYVSCASASGPMVSRLPVALYKATRVCEHGLLHAKVPLCGISTGGNVGAALLETVNTTDALNLVRSRAFAALLTERDTYLEDRNRLLDIADSLQEMI